MAGDWIPMRVDLFDDPAVIAIATALGMDEYAVVGRLHRLWVWANRQLSNGDARGVTEMWIDRHVDAPGFAKAMVASGWLTVTIKGVEFPKFDRWNSQGAKRRILAAQRMKRKRDADSVTSSVTKAQPEKRREESKRQKTPKPPKGALVPTSKPRNLLFDAVVEVTGLDPATAAGRIGPAQALMAKADPPYTPDEVREFGRQFWQLCPWAAEKGRTRPTPQEIANHIGLIRSGPGHVDATNIAHRGFQSHDARVLGSIFDAMASEDIP